MKKERNTIAIIALIVAVVGLSVGFAAFATTLTISATATMTPSSSDFAVVFSTSADASISGDTGEVVTGGVATSGTTFAKDTTTLTNLSATFTAPGQTATWKVYAHNKGQYEAFLNAVTLGNITCAKASGSTASDTLVQQACAGLSLKVSVGGTEYTSSNAAIAGHSIVAGSGEEVLVTLTYAADAARIDGPADITIGNITLKYDSTDTPAAS